MASSEGMDGRTIRSIAAPPYRLKCSHRAATTHINDYAPREQRDGLLSCPSGLSLHVAVSLEPKVSLEAIPWLWRIYRIYIKPTLHNPNGIPCISNMTQSLQSSLGVCQKRWWPLVLPPVCSYHNTSFLLRHSMLMIHELPHPLPQSHD